MRDEAAHAMAVALNGMAPSGTGRITVNASKKCAKSFCSFSVTFQKRRNIEAELVARSYIYPV